MILLDAIQWATCGLSISGAFLVAGTSTRGRCAGFALFLISNVTLAWWAFRTGNHGIMTTQTIFAASSVLGLWNHLRTPPARTSTP